MKEAATLVYVTYIFPRALFPLHKASYLAGDITAWFIFSASSLIFYDAIYSDLALFLFSWQYLCMQVYTYGHSFFTGRCRHAVNMCLPKYMQIQVCLGALQIDTHTSI